MGRAVPKPAGGRGRGGGFGGEGAEAGITRPGAFMFEVGRSVSSCPRCVEKDDARTNRSLTRAPHRARASPTSRVARPGAVHFCLPS